MAAITKASLRDRVLRNIGVLAIGQSAHGEDQTLVEEAIDAVYDELTGLGYATFTTASIPGYAQSPLRDIVSADVAGFYGLQGQRLQLVLAGRDAGLARLRAQTSSPRRGLPTESSAY